MKEGRQEAFQPVAPGVQIFRVEGIGQAEHGRGVAHLLELLGHHAAHADGGAVGVLEFGVLGLQGLQLVEERVELGVADGGVVQDVVAVLVIAHGRAEAVDAGGEGRLGGWCGHGLVGSSERVYS